MNSNQDRLDDAIDVIAARMTHVPEDDGLALRIANSLPQRSEWLPLCRVARFALGALATIAVIVVLRTFDDCSTTVVLQTESAPAPTPIVEPATNNRRDPVEPSFAVRRTIVEPSLNVRRTTSDAERPDHERSLAAIPSPGELAIGSLSPGDLPAEVALTIPALEIAHLPLSSDFSPR